MIKKLNNAIKVTKSTVNGMCLIPPSKSYSIRALFAGLLNCDEAKLYNISKCEDVLATIEVIKKLGANISIINESEVSMDILISGNCGFSNFNSKGISIINCGESGLCARMIIPILGLIKDNKQIYTVTGRGSLLKRPFNVISFLKDFGMNIQLTNSSVPVLVSGNLKHHNGVIDLSLTTQVFSGLLMALPIIAGKSQLKIINKTSIPYVMATLEVLKDSNINIKYSNNMNEFEIEGNQKYSFSKYIVENDWSSAAFILVAGAIAGDKIGIYGLKENSSQADSVIIEILKEIGLDVKFSEDVIYVSKSQDIYNSFKFDAKDAPDVVPALVALATSCKGISEITNIDRLKYKESNRVESLIASFKNIGIDIWYETKNGGTMFIKGGKIKGGIVDSQNDHRIAMSLAVSGLVSEEGVIINNPYCVRKSFPNFFDVLVKISNNK
ncbi:3-phosphoshikimate 1-carboxyvinyltransferase [Marinitoga aeolica]|uniref:3-phosphoshikimate 1-carboxyvinyltransferase n=1 Tax=Marinitoga aeolica TaxID=2809031 RepID=A0ABY8PPL1_9BACT|nr:3-phosphoshikimate 1-carboxyvinyltransferase [Marinitoga aeolica]WGS64560.1 3-phosphoshikimate 1-carboxyvinyltransferase [Marinitoga aeolica]